MYLHWERKTDICYVTYVTRRIKTDRGKSYLVRQSLRIIFDDTGWKLEKADSVCGIWTPWIPVKDHAFKSIVLAIKAAYQFCLD